ncbi:MAG: carbohydrate-binding domain-containing protein, partial [Desulfovibrio sp.]|nr:carbohydrate-binding domain-containing protein [Desulfovibrio sp.]
GVSALSQGAGPGYGADVPSQVLPPVIPPPANAYDVRAVLHSYDAHAGESVIMSRVGQGANAITLIGWAAFGTENMGDYLTATVNGQGELVFTLTQAGVLACLSSPLEGYFRVTGNDGREHVAQVYVPQNSNDFNSQSFHSQYGDDAWYDDHKIQGEAHYGYGYDYGYGYSYDDDVYDIVSGAKADTIRLGGGVNNSTITTGDGDDEIHIGKYVYAEGGGNVRIDAGGDDNEIHIGGGVSTDFGSAIDITTGDGDDEIHIGKYVYAEGGDIRIDAGDGDDVIHFGDVVQAKGGDITIDTGDGGDEIHIKKYVYAYSGGDITITTGDGDDDDEIHIEEGVYAEGGGDITIDTGDGDDVIHFGDVVQAKGGDITIDTGDGDDEIYFGGWVDAYSGSNIRIDTGDGDDIVRIGPGTYFEGSGSSVIIDGGEGIDVLFLDESSHLNHTLTNMLSPTQQDPDIHCGTAQNMEIIVGKGIFPGDFSSIDSLTDIGISIVNGKISMASDDGGGWKYRTDVDQSHPHHVQLMGTGAYVGLRRSRDARAVSLNDSATAALDDLAWKAISELQTGAA